MRNGQGQSYKYTIKTTRALSEHPLNHYIEGKVSFFQPGGGSGNRKSPG